MRVCNGILCLFVDEGHTVKPAGSGTLKTVLAGDSQKAAYSRLSQTPSSATPRIRPYHAGHY